MHSFVPRVCSVANVSGSESFMSAAGVAVEALALFGSTSDGGVPPEIAVSSLLEKSLMPKLMY